MAVKSVLIIEEDANVLALLTKQLEGAGFEVSSARDLLQGLALFRTSSYDAVLTPLADRAQIPKMREKNPDSLIIILADEPTVEEAVLSLKQGAYEYFARPFSPDKLLATLKATSSGPSFLPHTSSKSGAISHKIIAESPAMKQILLAVNKIALTKASVMITGQSGTGKEVVAQALFQKSNRANSPFIKVNCAAIPESLVESEFFGHEKGAFTGASGRLIGRFERAHTGTILLDEITEIPLSMQAKLLRVLQEEELERVGGSQSVSVDVRVISTSNRDLNLAIEEKVLRADLYYRLNVIPLSIPPLKERTEDILPLAEYFLDIHCQENQIKRKKLTDEAKNSLLKFPWPGNVRQLSNIIERAVVLTDHVNIGTADLHLNPYLLQQAGHFPELNLAEIEKKISKAKK